MYIIIIIIYILYPLTAAVGISHHNNLNNVSEANRARSRVSASLAVRSRGADNEPRRRPIVLSHHLRFIVRSYIILYYILFII